MRLHAPNQGPAWKTRHHSALRIHSHPFPSREPLGKETMMKLKQLACLAPALLLLLRLRSAAEPIRFHGPFATDDQVALFHLVVNSTDLVTIHSSGYAAGTVGLDTLAAGGFAP